MSKRVRLTGVRALLEDVTISRVDMSPSGTSYRLWRRSRTSKGGDAEGMILVAEIHTGHIFDSMGRYLANDVIDEPPTPDA